MTREPQLASGIFFRVELGVKFVNRQLPTLADANVYTEWINKVLLYSTETYI